MAKNRLVFKKHPRPKGLAGIGSGFFIDIKINGKKCGLISEASAWHRGRDKISIQLSVKTETGWDWKFLDTKGLEGELDSKEFVKNMIEKFMVLNTMHYF